MRSSSSEDGCSVSPPSAATMLFPIRRPGMLSLPTIPVSLRQYTVIWGSSAAFYLSAAKRVGIHTIAHSHGSTRFINGKAVAYAFFSYWTRFVADAFFACSLVAGQDRFGQRVAGSDRFRLVMNAFTVEKFGYSEQERHAVRKSLGLQDAFVIGHVGRFDIPKNHSFLLQVFAEVVAHHHEARLLLVGDGERRDAVERLIQELDLQDSVILLGMRQDVPSLLQAMDVFVFPSLVEGLGVSLVEAQACGLPCVASDRVPEEAKVTELVTFLPLSEPYAVWVDEICRVKGNSERKNRKGDVKAAGYDILDSAKSSGAVLQISCLTVLDTDSTLMTERLRKDRFEVG